MRIASAGAPAARAHACREALAGSPRRGTAYCTLTLLVPGVRVVRVDDARHEGMAHDVLRAEVREGDAANALQDAPRLDQSALLPAREVDLRDVAVHHRLGAEADARQEHLHL